MSGVPNTLLLDRGGWALIGIAAVTPKITVTWNTNELSFMTQIDPNSFALRKGQCFFTVNFESTNQVRWIRDSRLQVFQT